MRLLGSPEDVRAYATALPGVHAVRCRVAGYTGTAVPGFRPLLSKPRSIARWAHAGVSVDFVCNRRAFLPGGGACMKLNLAPSFASN